LSKRRNTKHQSPQRSWTRIHKTLLSMCLCIVQKKKHKASKSTEELDSNPLDFAFYVPLCCPKRNKHKASKSTKEQDSNP
jgi:hypothetical protein